MSKILLFVVIGIVTISCKHTNSELLSDPMDSEIVLGEDKDKYGCVGSAGYRWSVVLNKCIRIFEEGFRLNPTEVINPEDSTLSAFVIFQEKGNKAELFIPGEKESIILERKSKQKLYLNDDWSLITTKGYTVKKGGIIKYTAADTVEKKEIGNDKVED